VSLSDSSSPASVAVTGTKGLILRGNGDTSGEDPDDPEFGAAAPPSLSSCAYDIVARLRSGRRFFLSCSSGISSSSHSFRSRASLTPSGVISGSGLPGGRVDAVKSDKMVKANSKPEIEVLQVSQTHARRPIRTVTLL